MLQSAVCAAPGGGSLLSPTITTQKRKPLLATRAWGSTGIPWVTAVKTGTPDVKSGHQTRVKAPNWKTRVLWTVVDEEKGWCCPSKRKKKKMLLAGWRVPAEKKKKEKKRFER